jgi:hypothetical protein
VFNFLPGDHCRNAVAFAFLMIRLKFNSGEMRENQVSAEHFTALLAVTTRT